MAINGSELILNPDGSLYHLNLKPGEIALDIITVGDPKRVVKIKKLMSHVHVEKEKREFYTVTGELEGKPLTVISTGIGTDNIDIVMNELDTLVNIDFETKKIKKKHTSLSFYRIGTTGGLTEDIALDSLVVSEYAIGMDGLLHYYNCKTPAELQVLASEIRDQIKSTLPQVFPYVFKSSLEKFDAISSDFRRGITFTAAGFYGPQGRKLRAQPAEENLLEKIKKLTFKGKHITNLEMETAAIYGISHLLGHQAVSFNVILANRTKGIFSKDPAAAVQKLIPKALEEIIG